MAIEILSNIVALKFKYLFVSYLPPGRPIRSWEFCDVHFNFDPTLQFVLIAPEWDTRLSVRHRFSTFCSHLICFTQNSGHQQGVDRSTKFYFHGRVFNVFHTPQNLRAKQSCWHKTIGKVWTIFGDTKNITALNIEVYRSGNLKAGFRSTFMAF